MFTVLLWCEKVAKGCKIPKSKARSVLSRGSTSNIELKCLGHFYESASGVSEVEQNGVQSATKWGFMEVLCLPFTKSKDEFEKRCIFPFQKCIVCNWCFWISVACKRKTRQTPYNPYLAQEYYQLLLMINNLFQLLSGCTASEYCCTLGLGSERVSVVRWWCCVSFP